MLNSLAIASAEVAFRDDRAAKAGHGIWLALLCLIVLSPLPFGSYLPWAWTAVALWVSLLLLGWSLQSARGQGALFWQSSMAMPLVLFLLFFAWVLLSVVDWPALGHPIWDMASEQLHRPFAKRISIAPEAVWLSLMRIGSYAGIFWLVLQYGRDAERAGQLLRWVVWAGFAYALYGLANFFAGNTHILWFERGGAAADVTSTFVNRNSYATYAGLGLISAIALGLVSFRKSIRTADRALTRLGQQLESFSGWPMIYAGMGFVIAMAWLQTHSRMGVAATLTAILCMVLMLRVSRLVQSHAALISGVGLSLLFLFIVSGQVSLLRIGGTSEIDRIPLFRLVIQQIGDAPWTGTGLGSFPDAFRMYRDMSLPGDRTFLMAHNSYLELAADTGLPGAISLVLSLLWLAATCLRGVFLRRQQRIYPILGLSAAILVGVHSLLDFSVQIPAVAILFTSLLALGVAQSWPQES